MNKQKKQAALRQAALTKRRKEQGLTRLQVWVTDEQKQKVLDLIEKSLCKTMKLKAPKPE